MSKDRHTNRGGLNRAMKWKCGRCLKKTVKHSGDAPDGRPLYRCGHCGDTHTCGHRGREGDLEPSNYPGLTHG